MSGRFLIPALILMMLSTSGCVSRRFYQHMHRPVTFPAAPPAGFQSACDRLHLTPTPWLVVVQVSTQTLALYEDGVYVRQFPCSTSRYGTGQAENSNRTPLGLHRIAEKIGAGKPPGTVFQSRQITGHTSEPHLADAKITTRILWLEGLDPGFNQDGNVDSHARYIYIHGTADQAGIGVPASCGCIHLADPDLIELFDLLPSGTMVWIEE
jgi:lipoprotein-anchoring transpeptidase ErfK/SrfK